MANDDPVLNAEAHAIANVAFREARDEGCTCPEPNIAISPISEPPFWRALVEHDETCALIRRLRRDGANL